MNKCVCVCLCIYFVICVYTISFLKDVLARRVCVCIYIYIYIYKRTRIRLPVFLCIIVQKRKEYIILSLSAFTIYVLSYSTTKLIYPLASHYAFYADFFCSSLLLPVASLCVSISLWMQVRPSEVKINYSNACRLQPLIISRFSNTI